MQTMVTARHCDIPDDLRRRALEFADKLAKIAYRPQRMEIVFDANHQRRQVELKMSLPRGQTLIASAEASDFQSALDRAVEKLRSQLDKGGARVERRQPTP